eukprot:scaffold120061_cov53-Phaeocystis_antarctica.AAC.4
MYSLAHLRRAQELNAVMASNAKGVATGTREATSAMGGKVSAPLPLSERRAGLTCVCVLLPRPTCTSFAFTLLHYTCDPQERRADSWPKLFEGLERDRA